MKKNQGVLVKVYGHSQEKLVGDLGSLYLEIEIWDEPQNNNTRQEWEQKEVTLLEKGLNSINRKLYIKSADYISFSIGIWDMEEKWKIMPKTHT